LNKKIKLTSSLLISHLIIKLQRFIKSYLVLAIYLSNFWYWLASQKGFSIKWQHIFRTCLTSIKNNYQTKIRVQMQQKQYSELCFSKFGDFFQMKNGNITTIFPFLVLFLTFLATIFTQKENHCWEVATS